MSAEPVVPDCAPRAPGAVIPMLPSVVYPETLLQAAADVLPTLNAVESVVPHLTTYLAPVDPHGELEGVIGFGYWLITVGDGYFELEHEVPSDTFGSRSEIAVRIVRTELFAGCREGILDAMPHVISTMRAVDGASGGLLSRGCKNQIVQWETKGGGGMHTLDRHRTRRMLHLLQGGCQ